MTNISEHKKTKPFLQTAVMRGYLLSHNKITFSFIGILTLIYVNTGLPLRVKRIDFGETFYELMY